MKGKCEWCGEEADIKNKIESVFHGHNNASGICKKVKLVGHFEAVDGTTRPKLCTGCRNKLINCTSAGGNHK